MKSKNYMFVFAIIPIALLLLSCNKSFSIRYATQEPQNTYPNIVLIVMDSVRWDVLSLSDNSLDTSPNLQKLAQNGILFQKTYSAADNTVESHFSIFTGLQTYLAQHDTQEISLVHILGTLGYDSLGISANRALSTRTMKFVKPFNKFVNLSEYFEELSKNPEQLKKHKAKIKKVLATYNTPNTDWARYKIFVSADTVLDTLSQYLPKLRQPAFIFLNFMDAHHPYLPPKYFYNLEEEPFLINLYSDLRHRPLPPWRYNIDLFSGIYFDKEIQKKYGDINTFKEEFRKNFTAYSQFQVALDLSPLQLQLYKNRYKGEIKWLDYNIAKVIKILEKHNC